MPTPGQSFYLEIDNACNAASVPGDEKFLCWFTSALAGLRTRAELAIRIVDEAESAALNAQYRNKNVATNVLSFPSDLPEDCEPPLIGDLAICAAVVEREAKAQHKALEAHWAHMVIHGSLHLLGFDHVDEDEAESMETREIAILQALGFANPYVTEEHNHHE